MSSEDFRKSVKEEMRRIAPDIDFETVDPDGDLREEFDIDSMDYLNLITALHKRFGIDIPEADYARIRSTASAVAYLQEKVG